MSNAFKIKSMSEGTTLVELQMTPSGGASFTDGGRAQQSKNDITLNKLKREIESSTPRCHSQLKRAASHKGFNTSYKKRMVEVLEISSPRRVE